MWQTEISCRHLPLHSRRVLSALSQTGMLKKFHGFMKHSLRRVRLHHVSLKPRTESFYWYNVDFSTELLDRLNNLVYECTSTHMACFIQTLLQGRKSCLQAPPSLQFQSLLHVSSYFLNPQSLLIFSWTRLLFVCFPHLGSGSPAGGKEA